MYSTIDSGMAGHTTRAPPTNTKAEEETYVKFPKSFPADLYPGYKGGTIERLNQDLYGSKSAPKLWYKCLYAVIIELRFKSVAGHP